MQITLTRLRPIRNNVFVTDLDRGLRRTRSGVILPDDDMKERGIRPRWAQVYAIGPDVRDLRPGEWVYVEHGRWTQGIDLDLPSGLVRVWRVDYPKAVMIAADDDPRGTYDL